jgi:hypothetical protein
MTRLVQPNGRHLLAFAKHHEASGVAFLGNSAKAEPRESIPLLGVFIREVFPKTSAELCRDPYVVEAVIPI